MNLSQLQTTCSYWLDDLSYGYFTQAQLLTWINNAKNELTKRLIKAGNARYNKSVTTTLVVNQNVYTLPVDFKKVQNLEVVMSGTKPNESTNPIQFITENQKYLVSTGTGTPLWYTFVQNYLYVRPAPDTALTLRLVYTYNPIDLVNPTDIPDAPQEYHEMIALLAAEDGFVKDGRANALIEKKIAAIQASIDSDAQERNQDGPRGIVETGISGETFVW